MITKTTFIPVAVALAATLGCSDSEPRVAELTNANIPLVFWAQDDGTPVDQTTSASAMVSKHLASSGRLVPLYDTDGERLTWGEARTPAGTLSLECGDGETRLQIAADGLRPDGVYTGWLAFFHPPGFSEDGLGAIAAISPVGPPDGSESVLDVDERGAATLTASVPPAAASVPLAGETDVPPCLLDTFELHVVLAYHLDGRVCGDNPCAEDTFVEHVAWVVTQDGEVTEEPSAE